MSKIWLTDRHKKIGVGLSNVELYIDDLYRLIEESEEGEFAKDLATEVKEMAYKTINEMKKTVKEVWHDGKK